MIRLAFATQVSAQIELAVQQQKERAEIRWEDLMKEAIRIWPLISDNTMKTALTRLAKKYTRDVFTPMGKQASIKIDDTNPNKFFIFPITPTTEGRIRAFLMSTAYRRDMLDSTQPDQLGLFD